MMFSDSCRSSSDVMLPVLSIILKLTTPEALGSKRETTGSSAPLGRLAVLAEIFSRTLSAALSIDVPRANSILIEDWFSLEVEVTLVTPLMVPNDSSSGLETNC